MRPLGYKFVVGIHRLPANETNVSYYKFLTVIVIRGWAFASSPS